MYGLGRMTIHPHVLTIGTEHIQFSPTRQALPALGMKHREVLGWGGAGVFVRALTFLCF